MALKVCMEYVMSINFFFSPDVHTKKCIVVLAVFVNYTNMDNSGQPCDIMYLVTYLVTSGIIQVRFIGQVHRFGFEKFVLI